VQSKGDYRSNPGQQGIPVLKISGQHRIENYQEAQDILLEASRAFQKDGYTIGAVFGLEGIAALYAETGKHEQAARLLGMADTIREKIGDVRPLIEQVDVDKTISTCLIKMGEAAFSDDYDLGAEMTLAEAVTFAMKAGSASTARAGRIHRDPV